MEEPNVCVKVHVIQICPAMHPIVVDASGRVEGLDGGYVLVFSSSYIFSGIIFPGCLFFWDPGFVCKLGRLARVFVGKRSFLCWLFSSVKRRCKRQHLHRHHLIS